MPDMVPTCTGIVVLPLKFTDDPMSTVGLPLAPVPLVTAMLDDPAAIVRLAVTPGDVSTTRPLDPGSDIPQVSVPDEFIQHTPEPALA
jgi:hypothetical protein